MVDWVVVPVPDGVVLTAPTPALVYSGIGFRKESRKAGVPNVSVKAIPRTYSTVSFLLGSSLLKETKVRLTPSPKHPIQYLRASSLAFS